MKSRIGFVSNSSSSSFIVPVDIEEQGIRGISCIKLPREIWRAIERNHVEWNGKKFDLSSSHEWWLTEMVSDCTEAWSEISDIPNAIAYLEGNDMPYGCYDEEGEKAYIKFRKDDQNYWVLLSDFIDEEGDSDIPESVELREKARRIFNTKALNKTQKLNALMHIFDF